MQLLEYKFIFTLSITSIMQILKIVISSRMSREFFNIRIYVIV